MEARAGDGVPSCFKHPVSGETLVIPHPKKDLGKGLVRAIYLVRAISKGAGWKLD